MQCGVRQPIANVQVSVTASVVLAIQGDLSHLWIIWQQLVSTAHCGQTHVLLKAKLCRNPALQCLNDTNPTITFSTAAELSKSLWR